MTTRSLVGTLAVLGLVALRPAAAPAEEALKAALDVAHPGHEVPKTLYGIFFEDINFAADGGIYPELVANRGFDWETENHGKPWPDARKDAWERDFRGGAMGRITREFGRPLADATAAHLRIECFGPGTGCGVRNVGFDGIAVEAGKKYDLSFYARGLDGYRGGVRVVLEDAGGGELAACRVANAELGVAPASSKANHLDLPAWKRHAAAFAPARTVRDAHLAVLLDAPGVVELEQVSLYPQDTFNGRKNGLRKDLVQLLKDLHPGVMRFPGGCVTEGRNFNLWYDWKLSVGEGPVETRKPLWNGAWGYWQSFGLGYFEYLCLCEDIGAEPLPVMGAGVSCQFAGPVDFAPMDAMGYFARSMCDLVEFANGSVTSKWGALRASMGHPAPFNLHYIGIGNENWDKAFLERYLAIHALFHAEHPEIRVVSTAGAGPAGAMFDLAWRTLSTNTADVVDEHFYVSPEWLRNSAHRYDNYDRAKPHVYAGEYACHKPGAANDLYAALCEAALLTGIERNSDVVEMSSYAPLFARLGHAQWRPDLIWFDGLTSFGTPSYYVQKLFMRNRPTRVVPVKADLVAEAPGPSGPIALQTWNTAVEFKDIAVTGKDGKPLAAGLGDLAKWHRGPGDWSCAGGVIRQRDVNITDATIRTGSAGWSDYTLSFKARRTGGSEGLIVAVRDQEGRAVRLNLGGWGNTRHAIEFPAGTVFRDTSRPGSIQEGRWYEVKIALAGDRVSAWLDGVRLYDGVSVPARALPGAFIAAGLDEPSGELVVKCVNAFARPLALDLAFGRALPAGRARRTVLTGDPGAVNDVQHPARVAPVEDGFAFPGGDSLKATLAPSSLTVFRLSAGK